MKSSSVSECKTCHKPLITDWNEGDCIKCARDKVLNQTTDSGKPSLAEHNKQVNITSKEETPRYTKLLPIKRRRYDTKETG